MYQIGSERSREKLPPARCLVRYVKNFIGDFTFYDFTTRRTIDAQRLPCKKRISKGFFYLRIIWMICSSKTFWMMLSADIPTIFDFIVILNPILSDEQNWVWSEELRVQSFCCGNSHTSRLLFRCHDWHRFETILKCGSTLHRKLLHVASKVQKCDYENVLLLSQEWHVVIRKIHVNRLCI